jgi:predicted HTH transcriptional regulator
MPQPRDVFERPEDHWAFLKAPSDTNFEGQHFDRKEAGKVGAGGIVPKNQFDGVIDQVTECISAFSNYNREGGLLAVGISTAGEVVGIDHLNDEQRGRLTNIGQLLKGQCAEPRFVDYVDHAGNLRTICLIYVPYSEHDICETLSDPPKAWVRQGAQNIFMTQSRREQICRDKRIVNWEMTYCCPYDPDDLDREVLAEFRNGYLADATYDTYSDEQLLRHAGAIIKDGSGYAFTNIGFLFFAQNPQRVLPASYIRLLRFEVPNDQYKSRGLPTFEKAFKGPLTKQIRAIRTFFQQSGFFKVYQRRNPEGGFIEDPEYPFIALDEAIVNAVAHRDYAAPLPIECEAYRNAFTVGNAGRLLQRSHDVPPQFSLADTTLESTPRNPMLIEWLKMIRDGQGAAFLRALSEGTKRMRDEMLKAGLPAPLYKTTESQTLVILYNNAFAREAALKLGSAAQAVEFTNLYPINITPADVQLEMRDKSKIMMATLKDRLEAAGWFIDQFKFGRLLAHKQGRTISVPTNVARIVRLYPGYSFQWKEYRKHPYLCIDFHLEVKNVRALQELLSDFHPGELAGKTASINWNGWRLGRIIAVGTEDARVFLFDYGEEQVVSSSKIIPDLPRSFLMKALSKAQISFDLSRKIKEESLASVPGAARIRAERTQAIAEELAETVFPFVVEEVQMQLGIDPAPLVRTVIPNSDLQVMSLPEPKVEFYHHQETVDIREGITRFGAYDHAPRTIELIPICTPDWRAKMATLIDRLMTGKSRYRGAERTFSVHFTYPFIVTVPSPEDILEECRRLLAEHPDWSGDKALNRIFLIHTPERGYSSDDENSPYYMIKRFLLEQGVPCQMVDSPTLDDPEWKDLNLALNITAKCGVVPWVLPDAMPDADFFVGLSFTQSNRGGERLMGYANVFNRFGRWEFYSGNTETFLYEERTAHLYKLVRETLRKLTLSETPSIYFHYSSKFSRTDRESILDAARVVRPQGTYSFVWINTQHNVRFYDSRNQTDGSLSRGSYVISSPHQFYLSTTGYNPFRKMLGTPEVLEVNVRTERPPETPNFPPDLRAIAVQVLSLTKLNWASTDSLCGIPITIKYAGDIAYLTAAFLRQEQSFHLHPTLEKTPWFL